MVIDWIVQKRTPEEDITHCERLDALLEQVTVINDAGSVEVGNRLHIARLLRLRRTHST